MLLKTNSGRIENERRRTRCLLARRASFAGCLRKTRRIPKVLGALKRKQGGTVTRRNSFPCLRSGSQRLRRYASDCFRGATSKLARRANKTGRLLYCTGDFHKDFLQASALIVVSNGCKGALKRHLSLVNNDVRVADRFHLGQDVG